MTTTTTHPLDRLPLGERDRRWIQDALDRIWDEPVSEYDLADVLSHPYGVNAYRAWEAARSTPVIRYADHRPARRLDDMAAFDPIPSRGQVLAALEAAATEWMEELA